MFTIGCHLSTKKGFLHMAQETVSMQGNTFQYFTRNPRGGHIKEIDPTDITAYKAYADQHDIKTLMAYAPYDIEPASNDLKKRDFALLVMAEDMARTEEIPHQMYLVRPGSALGQPKEQALANVASAINQTLTPAQTTKLLICTMPGEGTQIGSSFEELATIFAHIDLVEHVGICLDASAVWACGYDIVNDLDGVLDEFDKSIGLHNLCAIHLNDCKEPCGSRAVRHTRIGEGAIGFDTLAALVTNPRTATCAFYLEEPGDDLAIYTEDLARFHAVRTD